MQHVADHARVALRELQRRAQGIVGVPVGLKGALLRKLELRLLGEGGGRDGVCLMLTVELDIVAVQEDAGAYEESVST